jgi:hypothetical protein
MADNPSSSGAAGKRSTSDDPLTRLEQRLDRASDAAERLISEAAQATLRRPPPAGWQSPEPEHEQEGEAGTGRADLEPLLEALRGLRDRLPPDLQRRLGEALRELLLALRALIDWYLERTERRHREPAEVQDIPIT